jgi:hypothetical protein
MSLEVALRYTFMDKEQGMRSAISPEAEIGGIAPLNVEIGGQALPTLSR